jgi:hypothetical protein
LLVASVGASIVLAWGYFALGPLPVVVLLILPWLVVFFYKLPLLLTLLWPAAFFYDETIHDTLSNVFPILAHVGSVLLLPLDIPYFFTIAYLSICVFAQPRKLRHVASEYPFLIVFLILVVISVVVYTPYFGKMAIGEARKSYFCFLFPILALSSIKTVADLHRLLAAAVVLALGVSLIGYLLLFTQPSVRTDFRAISAGGALILLFATFAVVIAHSNGVVIIRRHLDNLMVFSFLPLIFMTHHRTVFLAATIGVVLLYAMHANRMVFMLKAVVLGTICLTAVYIIFVTNARFERLFLTALAGILQPSSDETGAWRLAAWREQLFTLSESQWLFGKGLGSYYDWYYGLEHIQVGPHDGYVQIVLKLGLVGLLVYALFAVRFFRQMFLARKTLSRGPYRAYIEIGLVNVAAAHALMTGYDIPLIVLIYYAIGMVSRDIALGLENATPMQIATNACTSARRFELRRSVQ